MPFDTFLKLVGRKIAAVRKERRLTQKVAAQRAGISYRYFQNIETGTANMTLSTMYKLAHFFDVRVGDFVQHHDNRASD